MNLDDIASTQPKDDPYSKPIKVKKLHVEFFTLADADDTYCYHPPIPSHCVITMVHLHSAGRIRCDLIYFRSGPACNRLKS